MQLFDQLVSLVGAALILAAWLTATLTSDGESTWFEGVQLLAVYAVLGLVFFYA